MDQITLRRHGKLREVEGRVELTGQDDSILLLARDGVLWSIMPDEIVKHTSDEKPYQALSVAEMTREMKGQLPKGFEVYETTHYLIFHSTSRAYAHWCGTLLERLYTAFHTFWTRKGFDLAEPDSRLVAVIFADEASYRQYLHAELGGNGGQMIGYFNLLTNRVNMYDLTGTQSGGRANRLGSSAQINQVLSAPDAVRNVATIVHEATHQIAFNCGLHTRLSDCPLWFSEGIAVFCETPDLRSAKGWSGMGGVNPMRLPQFRPVSPPAAATRCGRSSATDKRFRDRSHCLDAYAEAWALTYFLIRQHSKQYVEYLRMLLGEEADPHGYAAGPDRAVRAALRRLERLDADFSLHGEGAISKAEGGRRKGEGKTKRTAGFMAGVPLVPSPWYPAPVFFIRPAAPLDLADGVIDLPGPLGEVQRGAGRHPQSIRFWAEMTVLWLRRPKKCADLAQRRPRVLAGQPHRQHPRVADGFRLATRLQAGGLQPKTSQIAFSMSPSRTARPLVWIISPSASSANASVIGRPSAKLVACSRHSAPASSRAWLVRCDATNACTSRPAKAICHSAICATIPSRVAYSGGSMRQPCRRSRGGHFRTQRVQRGRRTIRREDQLPALAQQAVDRVQQFDQRGPLAGEKLDVVQNQQLDAAILAAKTGHAVPRKASRKRLVNCSADR